MGWGGAGRDGAPRIPDIVSWSVPSAPALRGASPRPCSPSLDGRLPRAGSLALALPCPLSAAPQTCLELRGVLGRMQNKLSFPFFSFSSIYSLM